MLVKADLLIADKVYSNIVTGEEIKYHRDFIMLLFYKIFNNRPYARTGLLHRFLGLTQYKYPLKLETGVDRDEVIEIGHLSDINLARRGDKTTLVGYFELDEYALWELALFPDDLDGNLWISLNDKAKINTLDWSKDDSGIEFHYRKY